MKLFKLVYWLSRKFPGGTFLLRILYGCDIPRKATIGKNVEFAHRGLGTVINANSVIEDGVIIQHHVTLGRKDGVIGAPIIRKKAYIGAYAMILGSIEIGENATIGMGTLVMKDVESNSKYVNKRSLDKIE